MFKDACCGFLTAEMVVSATGVVGNNYQAVSLLSHIKVHPNPKTNLSAKTNPNPDLQKTWKKNI